MNKTKRFGQNFLVCKSTIDRILQECGNISKSNVLEIGPGSGFITKEILNKGVSKLVSVEIDKELYSFHEELVSKFDNYSILFNDALKIEEDIIECPITIISNLPYYISTKLLFKWVLKDNMNNIFDKMILMFQKEVAERIIAVPGNKNYCKTSIITQIFCHVRYCFTVSKSCFSPKPKVESAIVEIIPKNNIDYHFNMENLIRILDSVFAQRRKTIKNGLKKIVDNPESFLKKLDIDSSLRPEQIPIKDFCKLSTSLVEG